jgi:hypothetical protein
MEIKVVVEFYKNIVEDWCDTTFSDKEWKIIEDEMIEILGDHFYDVGKKVLQSYLVGTDRLESLIE